MDTIDALAERVSRGDSFTSSDARLVLDSHDLIAIGAMADEVRRRLHGPRTTFVRVFEIHVDAPVAALPDRVTAGEFRVIGRPASVTAAVEATRASAALASGAPVSGFSLTDLQSLAAAEGRTLTGVCADLRAAGLDAIAEVPVDLLRTADVIGQARAAHLTVARLTVHALAPEARITVADAARALQDAVGGFTLFAPLPRTMSVTEPSTGYDDVRQVALARLLVSNIDSIQIDWALYGPKLAQVALTVGADDVDGVAAFEPGLLGSRRSVIEEILGNIRAAALEPVERNGRFEVIGA